MPLPFAFPKIPTALAALGLAMLLGAAAPAFADDVASSEPAATASSSEAAEPAAPTEEQILAGLDVWKDRGGCFNCHGSFGQGGEGGHFPAGPSLRKTQLDAETMHMVIACGLPGSKMPYNLKGGYTETECYGNDLGAVPEDVNPGAALSDEEITDLVAYIESRMVGQRRITRDQCVEFFGDPNAPDCAAYR